MATFGGLVLTNNGRNLLAKVQTGKLLNFKKIVLGDGELGSSESMVTMSQLKNQVLACNISKIQTTQEQIATLSFILNNQNLETGFYWRELGVIAEDPDTKEEILYCYGNARENGEYISATGGADLLEKNINIDLIVSNVENISATINESLTYATKEEIEQLKTDVQNAKTKLAGIDENANNYTLPTASNSTLGGIKIGQNLSIDSNGTVSATDTTYDKATTTANGLMSSTDKTKLDGIEAGVSALRCRTVTLATANWVQNTTTNKYEYTITDTTVTASHLVEGYMDLDNQEKMTDGYIESYDGSYKIITSEKPTSSITMNITMQKTTTN